MAGINTDEKQICSDNPLPHWIFTETGKEFQSITLCKIIETEGCAPDKCPMVRISQSIRFIPCANEFAKILSASKRNVIKPSSVLNHLTSFSGLSEESQKLFLSNPPLVLISVQLLLRKYGIYSQAYPIGITIDSKDSFAAKWHLNIQGYNNIEKLYKLCGKFMIAKKDKFESYLDQRKRVCLPRGLRISYCLINALKIQATKGYFTANDLVKLTNRNNKTIHNTIGNLSNNNLIKMIKKEKCTKFWSVTEKGREYTKNKREEVAYLELC